MRSSEQIETYLKVSLTQVLERPKMYGSMQAIELQVLQLLRVWAFVKGEGLVDLSVTQYLRKNFGYSKQSLYERCETFEDFHEALKNMVAYIIEDMQLESS